MTETARFRSHFLMQLPPWSKTYDNQGRDVIEQLLYFAKAFYPTNLKRLVERQALLNNIVDFKSLRPEPLQDTRARLRAASPDLSPGSKKTATDSLSLKTIVEMADLLSRIYKDRWTSYREKAAHRLKMTRFYDLYQQIIVDLGTDIDAKKLLTALSYTTEDEKDDWKTLTTKQCVLRFAAIPQLIISTSADSHTRMRDDDGPVISDAESSHQQPDDTDPNPAESNVNSSSKTDSLSSTKSGAKPKSKSDRQAMSTTLQNQIILARP